MLVAKSGDGAFLKGQVLKLGEVFGVYKAEPLSRAVISLSSEIRALVISAKKNLKK